LEQHRSGSVGALKSLVERPRWSAFEIGTDWRSRGRRPAASVARVLDGRRLRDQLAAARIYLVFTPDLCAGRDPLSVLASVLPSVDVVQVRPKEPDAELDPHARAQARLATTNARELFDWTARVLELVRASERPDVLVIANDRVDVARALLERGCAGVHVGQDDTPPRVARELLGPDALIGLSTHSMQQIALALEEPVDYLGFGPIHATATKGYVRGLGPDAAWVAQQASAVPVFPIGGIGIAQASALANIGRAAISSAILGADDPAVAARTLRALLER
jgi:thiamine-phosphate pyrophosphorylase